MGWCDPQSEYVFPTQLITSGITLTDTPGNASWVISDPANLTMKVNFIKVNFITMKVNHNLPLVSVTPEHITLIPNIPLLAS